MRINKTLCAVLLAGTMILTALPFASTAKYGSFKDVSTDNRYYESIEWANKNKFMIGTSENTFTPNDGLTRAQFAKIMANFSKADMSEYEGVVAFSDVATGLYYSSAVAWAKATGVMSGTTENTFSPNSIVTRQEAAKAIQNYINSKNFYLEYVNRTVELGDRGDAQPADWAKEACDYIYKTGVINLDESQRLYPKQYISRAEAAYVLQMLDIAIGRLTEKRTPKTIVYMNSQQPIMDDEFEHIDIVNIHPAHADGVTKTVNTDFVCANKIKRIREAALKQNPDIKFVVTIAVSSGNDIEKWLNGQENCDDFANTLVNIVKDGNFDGVDFDYEFPTGDISQVNLQYTLTQIRSGLDELAKTTNKDYIISMALPGGVWAFSKYDDLSELQHYVDYFNFMDYDLRSEMPITYNHASTYDSTVPYGSTYGDVLMCIQSGIQRSKIIIGAGMYGQSWINVKSSTTCGLNCPGTPDNQNISYSVLRNMLNYENPSVSVDGFYTYWDNVAKSVSVYNPESGVFHSFDDERSVQEKCQMVLNNNIGGIMFFDYTNVCGIEIGEDDEGEPIRLWFFNYVNRWLGKN